MPERVKGTVRWFSWNRGYGFCNVDGDETKIDYFVHYSSIDMVGYKMLKPRQPVTFVLQDTSDGIQAVEVIPEPD